MTVLDHSTPAFVPNVFDIAGRYTSQLWLFYLFLELLDLTYSLMAMFLFGLREANVSYNQTLVELLHLIFPSQVVGFEAVLFYAILFAYRSIVLVGCLALLHYLLPQYLRWVPITAATCSLGFVLLSNLFVSLSLF